MGSQGKAMSPSEEPTTTKAERVVIVGYNKASLFLPAPRPGLPRYANASVPFPSLIPLGAGSRLDDKKAAVVYPRQ